MSPDSPSDRELRQHIEAVSRRAYSTEEIELRIADSLLHEGRFEADIDGKELAIILRNVVYTMFDRHKLAGLSVGLVHNVPTMRVRLRDREADIYYVVHVHKPIVAFLEFSYTLINDPVAVAPRLRLKRGTFRYAEKTRRFDLKAKAALAAVNITGLARQELSNVSQIINQTLPPRLEHHGLNGILNCVELTLNNQSLRVCLEGKFNPITND
ncbi:MAG: hypothetical protein R3300_18315 [Candidatus Promineifilaceae bacterium]|nr:hypothetical protein [Candidatus Promineifilaceae bacterium]